MYQFENNKSFTVDHVDDEERQDAQHLLAHLISGRAVIRKLKRDSRPTLVSRPTR